MKMQIRFNYDYNIIIAFQCVLTKHTRVENVIAQKKYVTY